jgi:hypothetical protein
VIHHEMRKCCKESCLTVVVLAMNCFLEVLNCNGSDRCRGCYHLNSMVECSCETFAVEEVFLGLADCFVVAD